MCAALLLTLITGLIFLCGQQIYRNQANDPQIRMAADIAGRISRGYAAGTYFSGYKTAISVNPGIFVTLFDARGRPLRSSGMWNGRMPAPPAGVFEAAKRYGEDRITWQPERGVRLAVVVAHVENASTAYVLVGRSLKEAARRTADLRIITGLTWIAGIVLIALHALFFRVQGGRLEKQISR
jgi:hypothetical protein